MRRSRVLDFQVYQSRGHRCRLQRGSRNCARGLHHHLHPSSPNPHLTCLIPPSFNNDHKSVFSPLLLLLHRSPFSLALQVKLALKEDWGGEGRLGCNVGQGLLHRLPFTALITDYVEPAIDEPLPAEPIVLEVAALVLCPSSFVIILWLCVSSLTSRAPSPSSSPCWCPPPTK